MDNKVDKPLRLVDGQFMRGDEVVAPEIGNREQIALLQAEERRLTMLEEQAKSGGLRAYIYAENVSYVAICEFDCVCGYHNRIESLNQFADYVYCDDIPDYEDEIIECCKCRTKYIVEGNRLKPRKKI